MVRFAVEFHQFTLSIKQQPLKLRFQEFSYVLRYTFSTVLSYENQMDV